MPEIESSSNSALISLNNCPCRLYLRFLLGKSITIRNEKDRHRSRLSRQNSYLRILRFFLPTLIALVFFVDFFDWLMHNDSLIGISATTVRNKQSPIISMFAFLRSQFTNCLGASATFVVIQHSQRFIHCLEIFVELKNMLNINNRVTLIPLRVKVTLCAFTYVATVSILRLIYYIYGTVFTDIDSFWLPTQYFIFTFPTGVVMLIIQISVITSELSLIPLYLFYVHICTQFTICSDAFNEILRAAIRQLQSTKTSEKFNFDILLKTLVEKEKFLILVLEHTDNSLSVLLINFLFGDISLLASITAQGFLSSVFSTPLSTSLFAASISTPVIALSMIVFFATKLHETVCGLCFVEFVED